MKLITRNYRLLTALLLVAFAGLAASLQNSATITHGQTTGPAFPLKASENKRYLVDQNNQPFFYHCDTLKLFQFNMNRADMLDTLNDRQAKGFNCIQLHAALAPDVRQTETGQVAFNPSTDITKPNEDYWAFQDWIIQEARNRGMVVAYFPLWHQGAGFGSYMNENNSRTFGRWLGDRYKNVPNIIYVHGGDADPGGLIEEIRALAEGIIERDSSKLHSYHAASPHSSREVVGGERWLSFNWTYTYRPEYEYGRFHVYHKMREDYNWSRVMPAFLGESNYERFGAGAELGANIMRRQAYWAVLAGGTGHTYGGPLCCSRPDNWRDLLNLPGAQDMTHVKQVFTNYAWWKLVPDQNQTVVTGGYGSYNGGEGLGGDDYVTAGRANDGSLVMAYIPPTGTNQRTLTINMTKLTGTVTAQWFNPSNGNYTTIGTFSNSGSRNFTTPGNNGDGSNDWLLVLTAGGGGGGSTNLVSNPGFEANSSPQTPNNWGTWAGSSGTHADADYTENLGVAHGGSQQLAHWKNSNYEVYTYQNFSGLANGTYKLTAWVESSGGQNYAFMSAKGYGSGVPELTANIPGNTGWGSSDWRLITISDINVTNGQLTIGFYSNANGGNWIRVDDVELRRQQ